LKLSNKYHTYNKTLFIPNLEKFSFIDRDLENKIFKVSKIRGNKIN